MGRYKTMLSKLPGTFCSSLFIYYILVNLVNEHFILHRRYGFGALHGNQAIFILKICILRAKIDFSCFSVNCVDTHDSHILALVVWHGLT